MGHMQIFFGGSAAFGARGQHAVDFPTSLEGGKCYTYNVKVDTSGEVTVNSIEPGNWGDGGSYDLSTQ